MNKAFINGKCVEIEQKPRRFKEMTESTNANNALNEFMTSLANTDTNSIAKIRAIAQKFIEQTENV